MKMVTQKSTMSYKMLSWQQTINYPKHHGRMVSAKCLESIEMTRASFYVIIVTQNTTLIV